MFTESNPIPKGTWVEIDLLAPALGPRYGKVIRSYYVQKQWFGYLLGTNGGENFIAANIECTPITNKEVFELKLKGEL